MKKLITIILLISVLQIFGQDRVNRQKLSFIDKSNVLSKVTGWAYNSTSGEWIDYENTISNDKSYKTDQLKSLQGKYMMSMTNSFIDMQTKTLIFKENKYYVLIINKWTGSYYYPELVGVTLPFLCIVAAAFLPACALVYLFHFHKILYFFQYCNSTHGQWRSYEY